MKQRYIVIPFTRLCGNTCNDIPAWTAEGKNEGPWPQQIFCKSKVLPTAVVNIRQKSRSEKMPPLTEESHAQNIREVAKRKDQLILNLSNALLLHGQKWQRHGISVFFPPFYVFMACH